MGSFEQLSKKKLQLEQEIGEEDCGFVDGKSATIARYLNYNLTFIRSKH